MLTGLFPERWPLNLYAMLFLKVFTESVRQAWSQLTGNKLRTFLSLLGISIGIFCIIGVLSAVDSLESSVSESLSKLGDDIVYIDKWPWKDNRNDWWEIMKRPFPDHDDYEALREQMPTASLVAYWTVPGRKAIKYRKATVAGGVLVVGTFELGQLFSLEMEKGRYWTSTEYASGADKIIMGGTIAKELFGPLEPVGKTIRMGGRKYEVIGLLESSEGDLINPLDFDDALLVTYNNASRFVNLANRDNFGGNVGVKARPGVSVAQLEDDIRGVMRAARRLRPREEDNFALNKLSMIADAIGGIFSALNTVGWVIGGFSIIVGMISVANIMFVSVKERTNLIGVKKALGARRFVILLEFLTEAIMLCLVGGVMGLLLVGAIIPLINLSFESFTIQLSAANAAFGVLLSVVIGVLAGVIPALQAARMDAVAAMRA